MSERYTLMAMAENYANGHSWDELDGEACIRAAKEIEEADQIIRDLVLWINTKSKHLPEADKKAIWDYMKRKGIQGSVLRQSKANLIQG